MYEEDTKVDMQVAEVLRQHEHVVYVLRIPNLLHRLIRIPVNTLYNPKK